MWLYDTGPIWPMLSRIFQHQLASGSCLPKLGTRIVLCVASPNTIPDLSQEATLGKSSMMKFDVHVHAV